MYQLRLSGVLPRLGGLIVGQFTGYKPNDSALPQRLSVSASKL